MNRLVLLLPAILSVVSVPASAAIIHLDFEGIDSYPNLSNAQVLGYYNGGISSVGTTGTNYGVQFSADAFLFCLNTPGVECSNGSRGGEGISSSAFSGLIMPFSNMTINVAAGFDTGFAGVYSELGAGTIIGIFSELNGGGDLLQAALLPPTQGLACSPAYGNALFCPFETFSISFAGTAQSVQFLAVTLGTQAFDDLTFGSTLVGGIENPPAVPEPATWAMMVGGMALIGAVLRRRKVAVSFEGRTPVELR